MTKEETLHHYHEVTLAYNQHRSEDTWV